MDSHQSQSSRGGLNSVLIRPPPHEWAIGMEALTCRMPHHGCLKALWTKKWQPACFASVYPFHDGHYDDFEPLFMKLIANRIECGDLGYSSAFIEKALALEKEGDALLEIGANGEASNLYLRSACLLRIGRFPHIMGFPTVNCPRKWTAWVLQKSVYLKAAKLWNAPVEEVDIPHECKEGRDKDTIPAYVRVPTTEDQKPFPTVLLFTGLDGYRPDNTTRLDEFVKRGWAAIVVEIPGTADCPADPADPDSPDRLWQSLFQWMGRDSRFDMRRVMCWGLSAGGYYAVRIAHTHAHRLIGCVAQGAGTHHFFDPGWLRYIDRHEYPFELLPSLALKFGFGNVDDFRAKAQKMFSLVQTEIVTMKSTRLLLVNGTHDGLMPIEDSTLLFEYGCPKEAAFVPGAMHMGYPYANEAVYPWMEKVMATEKKDNVSQPKGLRVRWEDQESNID